MDQQFARDVLKGLSASPKFLSSKYFYDERGDALFQDIMALDEYYLTRCEYQILENEKEKLLRRFQQNGKPFDLIEFGAGDGLKTKVLLEHFLSRGANFTYMPIDISQNALDLLAEDLRESLPSLDLQTLQGEYFNVLSHLEREEYRTKVVLFLGSNIGNFLKHVAIEFLTKLKNSLTSGDMLLIGVDLIKDPKVIAKAYNDTPGVTRAFNMNLLDRINRELGGDFNRSGFDHYSVYDPTTGAARSYLISNKDQTVCIDILNATFHFKAWEPMYMELSQKYHLDGLYELSEQAGFNIIDQYFDDKNYFTDCVWKVK